MKTRGCGLLFGLCGLLLALSPTILLAQRESLEIEVLTEDDLPDVSEIEKRIRQSLRKKVNLNQKDATLQEIAHTLSEEFMISVDIDRVGLEDYGIALDDTYDLVYKNVRLGNALKACLSAVDLTYVISKEQLLITPADNWLTSTVIYDVSDLLASGHSQRVAVVRRGVTSSSFEFSQLIELIKVQCVADEWDDYGGPGTIAPAEMNGKQLLIVSQVEPGHEEVDVFLQKLRKAGGVEGAEKREVDRKEPVMRVYPLQHDLKSSAEEYMALIKTVIKRDWEDNEETSIKAIANTLVVRQPEAVQVKILGLLTDLDALLTPKNLQQPDGFGGFGGGGPPVVGGGGFFNVE